MNAPVQPLEPSRPTRLRFVGHWLRDHQRLILYLQWIIVAIYLLLLLVPLFLPLPTRIETVFTHLTLAAQLAFWGIWWPFVLLSIVALGRTWCGLFCPEGTLTEWASRHGQARAIPKWIRWSGWPLIAFGLTTIYGQLISVYQYPAATAWVLGGSTIAAMITGWLYGRERRVWCRYLCPVSGVFALLAKLAPWHYRVDIEHWRNPVRRTQAIVCAPLLPLRHMQSASDCHMCARCSDYRGAITLTARSCHSEILQLPAHHPWQTALIVVGLLSLAPSAFQWSQSPWLIAVKQQLAQWLIEREIFWPLNDNAPWYILTHYPQLNDSLNWLDGFVMLLYMAVFTLCFSLWLWCSLGLARRILRNTTPVHRLAQGLIPLAGAGVFTGLSATTLALIKSHGDWVTALQGLRICILCAAMIWTTVLLWKLVNQFAVHRIQALWAWILLLAGAAPSAIFWVRYLLGAWSF